MSKSARAVSPSLALDERCHFGLVLVPLGVRVSEWTADGLLTVSMSDVAG